MQNDRWPLTKEQRLEIVVSELERTMTRVNGTLGEGVDWANVSFNSEGMAMLSVQVK